MAADDKNKQSMENHLTKLHNHWYISLDYEGQRFPGWKMLRGSE
jgi:hypothetical protein